MLKISFILTEKKVMKSGDKVHYIPSEGCDMSLYENGIIKSETPNKEGFFVVYNCNGEWDRIDEYTAANTNKRDLRFGWHPEARNKKFTTDL